MVTAEGFSGLWQLTTEQLNTIAFVANHASKLSLRRLFPSADFAIMAHWRRALTLLLEIEAARTENRSLGTVDFARYAVNFDHRTDQATA